MHSKRFALSTLFAVALLLISLVANFYAGIYATERASNPVTDLVLDNIPVFDVDLIFIYGPFFLWLAVTALCWRAPRKIPFVLESIALFVLIRSLFITLTHIGPFPDHSIIDYSSNFVKKFTFGGDLFFSAHTGLPFLMALIFGETSRLWRLVFTLVAVFFGVIVLLGHLHYSIDVLSAFFITYTIHHLACWLFKKDYRLSLADFNPADLKT